MADRLSVLLVEDDPVDAQLLLATLRAPGSATYDITSVPTLADATACLARRPGPDVVLLDLSLPDSTGLGTLHRLLEDNGEVPVVVLTGLDDDDLASEAVEAGAQDYLVKGSVTGEVMRRAIRHAIERHQLQAALRERVKEQAGLLAISQALHRGLPTVDLCVEVASHLVGAMQWPSSTHATVTIDDARGTAGPAPPDDLPTLTAAITVDGRSRGQIVVGYVEPDRPFIEPQEPALLAAAADALAGWLERRDARLTLARDEERLRILVSQLPGVVWTTDTDLRVTSNAGALLADLEIGPDDLIGIPILDLLETEPPGHTVARFEAALAGVPQVFERHWQGRWWRNYVEPKRDAAGATLGTVCLSLDITTERRQRALAETERQRFQGLFVNAADAMILADDDGNYIDVNPAACDLTGYDRDELLTLRAWDLVNDADDADDAALAQWRAFLADGTMAGEIAIRHRDGATIDTDFRAVADIVPGVHLSILRDITQRRRAEKALAASETRFRAMAESAQDAIYRLRVEPEVAFDYLNPAAEVITGFSRDTFDDNPFLYLERTHPDDVAQLDPSLLGPTMTTTVKVRFQHADGHWIWLEDSRSPLIENRHLVGVQGVIRDITTREQTAQALRTALEAEQAAAERLRATDELKSSFLQAVSHELRTPLTSVLGYARTLVGHADRLTPEQVTDFHQRLADNASRLDVLLTDLLDIDRLNRGIVRLDLQRTDLAALASRAAATVDLGGRECLVDDTPAVALVDVRKVERIVHALLGNAAKHTPPGSTVWVACKASDTSATITVSDDGPGVPEADRDRVFEPFWQAPTMQASASPGTGIGLSLARQFATLHGGRAWVEERPGGGARFQVVIPTGDPEPAPTTGTAEPSIFRTLTRDDTGLTAFREMMQDTMDDLDTVRTADEATGIVLTWIQHLGGELTSADTDDDAILDIDLSLGARQPLRASAPLGSLTRRRLDNHLPFLLTHARRVLADRVDLTTDDDIDLTTGIVRPQALDRLLDGLHGHDTIMVLALGPEAPRMPDGEPTTIHDLAEVATRLSRAGDLAIPISPTELALLLPDTSEDRATTLLDRIRGAWQAGSHGIVAATAPVTTGAARQALAQARQQARA